MIEPKDTRENTAAAWLAFTDDFLIEELKPFIDRKYRTKPGAEFTGLGGSSLGGLATLAIGIFYSEVFTPFNCDVPIDLVGRIRNFPVGGIIG